MKIFYKIFLVLIIAGLGFVAVPTKNAQAVDCVGKGIITYSTSATSLGPTGPSVALDVSFRWGALSIADIACLDENISINFLVYANGNYYSLTRQLIGKVGVSSTRLASYFLTHAMVLANPAWLSANGTKLDTFARAENQQFPVERNDLAVVVSSHININFLAPTTHKACQNNACVNVQGPGADTCQTNTDCGGGGGSSTVLPNPIGIDTFGELVRVIGLWIFNLAIPIAVIVIIYAGILMLTAGGNPGKFQKGAKALWYAVLGLAIVFIGEGFVTLIESILSLRNP